MIALNMLQFSAPLCSDVKCGCKFQYRGARSTMTLGYHGTEFTSEFKCLKLKSDLTLALPHEGIQSSLKAS